MQKAAPFQNDIPRYVALLALVLVLNFVGDVVSALFVPITMGVDGLSRLLGYGLAGIPLGFVVYRLFKDRAKKVTYFLPLFTVGAAALTSIFNLTSDDRVFHLDRFLTFVFSSQLGLCWLVFLPLGAFLTVRVLEKRRSI